MGQTFNIDWKDFSIDSWKAEFSNDSAKFFGGKDKLGEIEFINSSYNITVKYYVFQKSDIDSVYLEAIENKYLMQSECLPTGRFSSFERGDFYYQTDICNSCGELVLTYDNTRREAPEKKTCDILIKELSQYIAEH